MRALSTLFKRIYLFCAIALGLALAVAYCSVYINPATVWIPAFFGLYFVPLVLFNLILLCASLLKRSKKAWIPLVALIPSLWFAPLFVRWGSAEESESKTSYRIATYNVCNFQGYGKKTREQTIAEIVRFLDREEIEIICMQEFFYPDTGKILELFSSFPYRCFSQKNPQKSYRGNVIFSRHPIEAVGEIILPQTYRTCIYADINLHGRIVRVYTTHLESNNISLNAMVDKIRKNQESPDQIYQAHVRIREAFPVRARQTEIIASHLRTIDMPFIFCGDLNDTPISYTYHQLQRGVNDSFRYAGRGFSATFRYLWPALRIDYIFYNSAFTVRSHQTVRVPFSDHYPVITELYI